MRSKKLDLQSIISKEYHADNAIKIIKCLKEHDVLELLQNKVDSYVNTEIKASYYRISRTIEQDKQEFSILNK